MKQTTGITLFHWSNTNISALTAFQRSWCWEWRVITGCYYLLLSWFSLITSVLSVTRRYGPLRRPSSRSCGGLRPRLYLQAIYAVCANLMQLFVFSSNITTMLTWYMLSVQYLLKCADAVCKLYLLHLWFAVYSFVCWFSICCHICLFGE